VERYETRSPAKSHLPYLPHKHATLWRHDVRDTHVRRGQCHIEIRLFAITRFCVFARIIPLPLSGAIARTCRANRSIARETRRAFPVMQLGVYNVPANTLNSRRRRKRTTRAVSIRWIEKRNLGIARQLRPTFAALPPAYAEPCNIRQVF